MPGKIQARQKKPKESGMYECWNGREYAGALFYDTATKAFYESPGGPFPVVVTSWAERVTVSPVGATPKTRGKA